MPKGKWAKRRTRGEMREERVSRERVVELEPGERVVVRVGSRNMVVAARTPQGGRVVVDASGRRTICWVRGWQPDADPNQTEMDV